MDRHDGLKRLFEQTRAAFESKRNRANEKKWARSPNRRSPDGAFNVFLGASYFSRALGVDLRDYYFDPVLYVETNLRLSLLKFEKFADDVALTKTIAWNPGVTMEPSFFGVPVIYQSDKEAWESRTPSLIQEYSDLASLEMPDFYNSKAMRHIHDMYERTCEITEKLAPDFNVSFPRWKRSPFGNACSLRGMEQLCFDFYDNPAFVHELMSFVTDARIKWEDECNKFLGQKCACVLANDEVNCPTVSPGQYAEFILPYEKRLVEYYGSLEYFHSCGNLTPLIPYIKEMEPSLFHVSPWTDLNAACQAFAGTKTVLDVWVRVTEDVLHASEKHARLVMERLVSDCRKADIAGFCFNSGNIQQIAAELDGEDEKILQWVCACRCANTGELLSETSSMYRRLIINAGIKTVIIRETETEFSEVDVSG